MISASNVYKYFIAVDILCGTTSILSLAAISVERMFAVKFPAKHFNLKSPPVFFGIIGTWVGGLIFTGTKFAVKLDEDYRIYTATIFTLAFLVPLIVIIMSYLMIFMAAVRMMKATNQPGTLQREIHIAKTISVIIALFLFCWMPFFIVNMVFAFCDDFCDDLRKYRWLIPVSKMMHYSNSMMNFFVYAVRSPDFRRTFKAILFKCDTSSLKERVRTISESIATRGRAASDRISFLHDNNNFSESPTLQHLRYMRSKLAFKQSRLSSQSYCTETSTLDDTQSNMSSSNSSTNPLLSQSLNTRGSCILDVANNSITFSEKYVSNI